jgi:hypothetical protein
MTEPIGALRAELSASSAQFADDLGKARGAWQRFGAALDDVGINTKKTDTAMGRYFTTTGLVTQGIMRFGSALHAIAWGTVIGAVAGLTLALAQQAKVWLGLETVAANVQRRLKENALATEASLSKAIAETALELQNLTDPSQMTLVQQAQEFGSFVDGTLKPFGERVAALAERLQDLQQQMDRLTGASAKLTTTMDPAALERSTELWKQATALLARSEVGYQMLFARLEAGEPLYQALAHAQEDAAAALTGEKKALDEATGAWDRLTAAQGRQMAVEQERIKMALASTGGLDTPPTLAAPEGETHFEGFMNDLSAMVPQMTAAQAAFGALSFGIASIGDAFMQSMQAGENFGKALKKSVAFTAASIAIQAALWALFDFALGLTYMAMGNEAKATQAFAAGKEMLITAAIAGSFAAAVGGFSGAGGGGGGGGGAGVPGEGLTAEGTAGGQPVTIYVTVTGSPFITRHEADLMMNEVLPAIGRAVQDNNGAAGPINIEFRRP